MKPASRIQAIIEILDSGHRARVPLNKCVGDYMRTRRYIGSKDRSAIAERIYEITRAHARLGWWLEHTHIEDSARNRLIAWLVLAEKADEKRLNDLFDGSQYAPPPLSDEERAFAAKLNGQPLNRPDMPDAVRVECPPEHEERLRNRFGADFEAEMMAMLEPAPLDLRANIFTSDRDAVIKSLKEDGIDAAPTPYSPWGVRCSGKPYIAQTKAFKKGRVEIQDEGSQLITWLCDAQPGMQVMDFCAGGGGKTLGLAAAMQRKGRVVAMDIDAGRLENGRKRYKKAGVADIIEVRPLSDERHRKWLKRQKGTFDIVLIDAPCSGSGTWRRNPDTRWQSLGPTIDALFAVQSDILDKAAKCVKSGGKLVYATCSIFDEENEHQINAFLNNHPDFSVVPVDPTLNIGSPYISLSPYRQATDGFFCAVLMKK